MHPNDLNLPTETPETTDVINIKKSVSACKHFDRRTHYKKTGVVLLMFTLVLNPSSGTQEIQINQLTYPIEFGGNATFLCSSNQSSLIGRCTWRRNSILIARDITTVVQHSKYIPTLHVNDTGVYYRLSITDFNSSDVDSLYSCDIDFDSQELFLSLNEDGFILKPEGINWSINETTCQSVSISIIIEQVYPKPTCDLFYAGMNFTRFLNASYQKEGHFYRIKLDINEIPCDNKCRDEFDISCLVGKTKYPILKRQLNICKANEDFTTIYIISIVSSLVFCCSVLLSWKVYRCYTRRSHLEAIGDPAENKMLPIELI